VLSRLISFAENIGREVKMQAKWHASSHCLIKLPSPHLGVNERDRALSVSTRNDWGSRQQSGRVIFVAYSSRSSEQAFTKIATSRFFFDYRLIKANAMPTRGAFESK